MNNALREYATSNAFVLTLSKNQMDGLALAVEKNGVQLSGTVANSLTRRGLIEYKSKTKIVGDRTLTSWSFQPTFAGKIVYQLLVEAGMYAEQDAGAEVLDKILSVDTDARHEHYAAGVMRDSELGRMSC